MPISSIHSFAAWSNSGRLLAILFINLCLSACSPPPQDFDADIIIIGGGIAGLAAGLEASAGNSSVIGLEMNSVGGGHAVMAGGMFLVNTPLQAAKDVNDSVELAMADMLAWGEDADADWVRRYVQASRPQVHDWLTQLGVEFALLMPAPGETSVPRFHFTRGTAVNMVVPMMQAGLQRKKLQWLFNRRAIDLSALESGGWSIETRDERTGEPRTLLARQVIVTTGGFENDLERVRANWLPEVAQPERLLAGASHFARGSGLDLGANAGAAVSRLDHQTIFVTGLPNPRDPSGVDGLLAQNPNGIFVASDGKRFVNEAAPRKSQEIAVLGLETQSYWLVFDARGRRRLQIRGAPWLTRETLDTEILSNPVLVQRADSLEDLAQLAGLPAGELRRTVDEFNNHLEMSLPDDFGRFGPAIESRPPAPIKQAPFYAMRLYPMTRKSMGGLQINDRGQVMDTDGQPLPGLYAAGEVTGVAGINGSYGGSGTFLGPSVFTGRLAGRSAVEDRQNASQAIDSEPAGVAVTDAALLDAQALAAMLASSRPGYWHFEQAHRLVQEKAWDCTDCHSEEWPTRPAVSPNEKRAQLESCARCH